MSREPLEEVWRAEAKEDLRRLADIDQRISNAALAALDDVLHRRKVGKALGERHVSGDLTGLLRIKFDIGTRRPERFRLVYCAGVENTVEVVALGKRDKHGVYRDAFVRWPVSPHE
jgi:phage-related protein